LYLCPCNTFMILLRIPAVFELCILERKTKTGRRIKNPLVGG
jgi:hypothetical protein